MLCCTPVKMIYIRSYTARALIHNSFLQATDCFREWHFSLQEGFCTIVYKPVSVLFVYPGVRVWVQRVGRCRAAPATGWWSPGVSQTSPSPSQMKRVILWYSIHGHTHTYTEQLVYVSFHVRTRMCCKWKATLGFVCFFFQSGRRNVDLDLAFSHKKRGKDHLLNESTAEVIYLNPPRLKTF